MEKFVLFMLLMSIGFLLSDCKHPFIEYNTHLYIIKSGKTHSFYVDEGTFIFLSISAPTDFPSFQTKKIRAGASLACTA